MAEKIISFWLVEIRESLKNSNDCACRGLSRERPIAPLFLKAGRSWRERSLVRTQQSGVSLLSPDDLMCQAIALGIPACPLPFPFPFKAVG